MTDSDLLAVVGTLAGIVLGLVAGVWWFWVPACLLLLLEIAALLPAGGGGYVVADEGDALNEIAHAVKSIERAQYND